jgi:hypothetical protein
MVKATDIIKSFEAIVRVKQDNGSVLQIKTIIQSTTGAMAKKLLQAQYGKGSVMGTPREIKA